MNSTNANTSAAGPTVLPVQNTNPDAGQQTGAKEPIDITNFLKHANHPCVVLFTLLFKASAITR
jgi:hypothetical protein